MTQFIVRITHPCLQAVIDLTVMLGEGPHDIRFLADGPKYSEDHDRSAEDTGTAYWYPEDDRGLHIELHLGADEQFGFAMTINTWEDLSPLDIVTRDALIQYCVVRDIPYRLDGEAKRPDGGWQRLPLGRRPQDGQHRAAGFPTHPRA